MTTSHRVDGLAFLNDDVVGECKHNRQIHKNNQVPQWGMMKQGERRECSCRFLRATLNGVASFHKIWLVMSEQRWKKRQTHHRENCLAVLKWKGREPLCV